MVVLYLYFSAYVHVHLLRILLLYVYGWACFFILRFYGLSRGTGVTRITNLHIIREAEKRQKDTGAAVDLSVSYEDYIACKDILARYNT